MGQIHNAGLATGRPGGTVGDHQVSVGNPRLSLIFSPITSPAPSLMDIEAGNQTFIGPQISFNMCRPTGLGN